MSDINFICLDNERSDKTHSLLTLLVTKGTVNCYIIL